MRNRLHQILLIATFLPLCWLLMQAVHELGHVACALATGGTISRVVLSPLTISRTDTSGSARPLLVVWAGPVVGSVLPLLLLGVCKATLRNWSYMLQFFAGTCLIANGGYIGVGSFGKVGDAGDMIRLSSPLWSLWLFGLIALPAGLYLWNGLGPCFGLGRAQGVVDRRAAYLSAGLLVTVVCLELAFIQPARMPITLSDGKQKTVDTRLSYEDTLKRLQEIGYVGQGESPPMPDHRPRYDDAEPLGFSFFRTKAIDDDLSGLRLCRTYFARSEINGISFANTDLSESTMCWNDFIAIDFSGARLTDCDMRASVFENCVFDNADMSGSDLRRSSFESCSFKGARMERAILASSQRGRFVLNDEQLSAIDWRDDDGEEPPGG
jgi:hypothetical protein